MKMTDKEFIKKVYELAFGDGAYDKGYSNHKEVLHQISNSSIKCTSICNYYRRRINELLIEKREVL